jgi:hypothetical protein
MAGPNRVFPQPLKPIRKGRARDRLAAIHWIVGKAIHSGRGVAGQLGHFAGCFFRTGGLFDFHVAELVGVKNFATLLALDEFSVFVPGNDAYLGVFAEGCHLFRVGVDSAFLPPECSGLSNNIKRNELDICSIFPRSEDFSRGWNQIGCAGLEIPTETVVY